MVDDMGYGREYTVFLNYLGPELIKLVYLVLKYDANVESIIYTILSFYNCGRFYPLRILYVGNMITNLITSFAGKIRVNVWIHSFFFGIIISYFWIYPEQLHVNGNAFIAYLCFISSITGFRYILVLTNYLLGMIWSVDVREYFKDDVKFNIVTKDRTYLSLFGCIYEDLMFIPLYSSWFDFINYPLRFIIVCLVFGLLHIPGRNVFAALDRIFTISIILSFYPGLLNGMIAHYAYNSTVLYLFKTR